MTERHLASMVRRVDGRTPREWCPEQQSGESGRHRIETVDEFVGGRKLAATGLRLLTLAAVVILDGGEIRLDLVQYLADELAVIDMGIVKLTNGLLHDGLRVSSHEVAEDFVSA